ncbi:MAG: SMC family ATPase [Actinomycetota bacterium]|nr:SMC family ATPase [Actinomycetota bacterium]
MRPIAITMEGFSTFLDRTEVDFSGVDLVALVGLTGSGKSSIIDAMTFALYGSVSRYHDARLVAPVIHQRANEARVRLDFEVGSQRYTAVRVVRRGKAERATTREARLERVTDVDDDVSPVMASGAKELTEAVEQLLGLDFTQFTRTVVLPQGEFAEFLTDDPASRQRLLRRLLDIEVYARMGAQARETAKAHGQRGEVLEAQIARYPEMTPELLDDRRRRLGALAGFAVASDRLLADLQQAEARLVELRTSVHTLDDEVKRLALVEVPDDLADRGYVVAEHRTVLDQARAELATVRSERDRALQAVAASDDPAAIEARLAALRRSAQLAGEIAALIDETQAADLAAKIASEAVAASTAETERATAASAAARAGADAAAWIAMLVVGEPCPVCRQDVAVVPDHDPSAELAVAEAALSAANVRLAQHTASANEASARAHTLTARYDDRRTELEALGLGPKGAAPDEIDQLELRLADARHLASLAKSADVGVSAAERAVMAAERSLLSAEEAEKGLRAGFNAQRDLVAPFGPPTPHGHSLADDWSELRQWADEQTVHRQATRLAVAEEGKSVAAAKAEFLEQLASLAQPLGLDPDPTTLVQTLARAQASTEAEIARIAERLAELDRWRNEVAGLRSQQRVHDSLGRHLAAGGFEGWLLTEALDDLVERASVRLRELSNGQYSLAAADRVFRIIDHNNAGEQRDVRTLSGGETFLASLALALALADSIRELAPDDSPRLGSMFLDEGFGTLDADTLDVVASTIEELSAGGRLIGIVTHIDALAERMPVRYQVSKGPASSSVERILV